MVEEDFNTVYVKAAQLYMASDLDIEVVKAKYGDRSDWEAIRMMLVGNDG